MKNKNSLKKTLGILSLASLILTSCSEDSPNIQPQISSDLELKAQLKKEREEANTPGQPKHVKIEFDSSLISESDLKQFLNMNLKTGLDEKAQNREVENGRLEIIDQKNTQLNSQKLTQSNELFNLGCKDEQIKPYLEKYHKVESRFVLGYPKDVQEKFKDYHDYSTIPEVKLMSLVPAPLYPPITATPQEIEGYKRLYAEYKKQMEQDKNELLERNEKRSVLGRQWVENQKQLGLDLDELVSNRFDVAKVRSYEADTIVICGKSKSDVSKFIELKANTLVLIDAQFRSPDRNRFDNKKENYVLLDSDLRINADQLILEGESTVNSESRNKEESGFYAIQMKIGKVLGSGKLTLNVVGSDAVNYRSSQHSNVENKNQE